MRVTELEKQLADLQDELEKLKKMDRSERIFCSQKSYEISKKVGWGAIEFVELVKENGVDIRNHMSTLSSEEALEAYTIVAIHKLKNSSKELESGNSELLMLIKEIAELKFNTIKPRIVKKTSLHNNNECDETNFFSA